MRDGAGKRAVPRPNPQAKFRQAGGGQRPATRDFVESQASAGKPAAWVRKTCGFWLARRVLWAVRGERALISLTLAVLGMIPCSVRYAKNLAP